MRLAKTLQEKPISLEKSYCTSAIIEAPTEMVIKEFPIPHPGKGEVRIKLEGSGVCASNIPVWEGRDWFHYPIDAGDPGHEGWGTIDAVGEGVTEFQEGDRVTALSYHAYATHDIAQAKNTVRLPEELKDQPFPGEPLGCAMNIFSRSDIKSGQTIAIVGCGFLGLLLIQLAKSAGAKIIAVSRRKFSLESAQEAGADHTILMDDHYHIIEKAKKITDGNLCERVIEATGKEWPLNLAIELTAERGKLIVAGFHQDGMRNVNVQMLNWRGIDMISAHERDPAQYIKGIQDAIRAIKVKKMNPFPFFTHTFPLEEAEQAFNYLVKRPDGFIKAIITTK